MKMTENQQHDMTSLAEYLYRQFDEVFWLDEHCRAKLREALVYCDLRNVACWQAFQRLKHNALKRARDETRYVMGSLADLRRDYPKERT